MRGYITKKLKNPRCEPCRACSGTGWMSKDYDHFECVWCNGKGQQLVREVEVPVKPAGKSIQIVTLEYSDEYYKGENPLKRAKQFTANLKECLVRAGLKPRRIAVTVK